MDAARALCWALLSGLLFGLAWLAELSPSKTPLEAATCVVAEVLPNVNDPNFTPRCWIGLLWVEEGKETEGFWRCMGRSRPESVRPGGGVVAFRCPGVVFSGGDATFSFSGVPWEIWSENLRGCDGDIEAETGGDDERREGDSERVGDEICTGSGGKFI